MQGHPYFQHAQCWPIKVQVGEPVSGNPTPCPQALAWLPDKLGRTPHKSHLYQQFTLSLPRASAFCQPLALDRSMDPREERSISGGGLAGVRRGPDMFCGP